METRATTMENILKLFQYFYMWKKCGELQGYMEKPVHGQHGETRRKM